MQYYDGNIYFVHNGCLYKNNTVIIASGKVDDAIVTPRGIFYLSENLYIALHKTPLYCKVPKACKLVYNPYNNWFAAYSKHCVYIIRPNCTVFKKYRFVKSIKNVWIAYDHYLSQLYLFIACGHHLYITNGSKMRHYYCADTIIAGDQYIVCHTTGFYARSYFTNDRTDMHHSIFSSTPSLNSAYTTDNASNIIIGSPIQKAFYLDSYRIPFVPDYGCVVVFSSSNNVYLLIIHNDGRAYTLHIASNVDEWIITDDDNNQYILYIRRQEEITRCNLNRELSYIIFADPEKRIPHYPPNYIKLEWKDCTTVAIKQIALIHYILRALKCVVNAIIKAIIKLLEWIINTLPSLFEIIIWYILFLLVVGIIKKIIF
ncbi:MAG: hypothetical protein N3F66_09645 [Spirochaetes bacterium]|nr:hypothetical protein [Spirochaetota bacterium]